MPYIDINGRNTLHHMTIELGKLISTEGELNYVVTRLLLAYVYKFGKSYKVINTVGGVLWCAGQEFYRRLAAPYEDTKINENGDVYL